MKFEAIFENIDEYENEEKENNDEDEENIIEEENKNENNENEDEDNDKNVTICQKDSIIKIKLFPNQKGYLLRFMKKSGEMEDFYKNLKKIYSIVENLL